MITTEDVEHIAKLARIKITQEEKEKLTQELGSIFGYIGKLNQLDTSNVEPTAQVTGLENIFREDKPTEQYSDEAVMRLLDAMPVRENGYLKAKAVFDKKN